MPNGKPGDHPLTDLLLHRLEVYGRDVDDALREIFDLGEPGESSEWFEKQVELEKDPATRLARVRSRLAEARSRDGGWREFAETPDPQLDAFLAGWPRWSELVAACHDDARIARVLGHHFGERAFEWLDRRPPVLEGASGRECLATAEGRWRLRAALQRIPTS